MKKVKNKIIALMLVIPMLLMFSMSTAANAVEILVDVPVSKVTLTVNGQKELEVDVEKNESIELEAKIEPSTATRSTVSYQVQAVDGAKQAEVIITDSGKVIPKSIGSVAIVAVAGAQQDSVVLTFTSDVVAEASQAVDSISLTVGEKKELKIGEALLIYPSSADYEIVFSSSNEKVATINSRGIIESKFRGECEITASIDGIKYDEESKSFKENVYEFTYKIKVNASDIENAISFEGNKQEISFSSYADKSTEVDLYIDSEKCSKEDIVFAYDEEYISSVTIEENGEMYLIKIEWKDVDGKYDCSVKLNDKFGNEIGVINFQRGVIDWEIDYDEELLLAVERNKVIDVKVNGISDYDIDYSSSDTSVAQVKRESSNSFKTIGVGEGSVKITVKLIVDGDVYGEKTLDVTVVKPYKTITVKNDESTASLTKSLARELVVGEYKYVGENKSKYKFNIPINVSYKAGQTESVVDHTKLIWKSSDDSLATVENGVLTVSGGFSGSVVITASGKWNEALGYEDIKASYIINVVAGAINVSNYEDLMKAEKAGYEVVLQDDIMLAPLLKENYENESWRLGEYWDYINGTGKYAGQGVYKIMNPTADISYYKGVQHADDAKLKYFVEFTNNVYGNGHSINADYLTRGGEKMYFGENSNSNGFIFNGPLSIVRISYGASEDALGNASVKSQDNIVFLVNKDNIKLRNVELKGCSDESVGKDLTNLDYCGTVLEVVGDNLELTYSKVNNGRTVVRIYGDANTDEGLVTANIKDYKITASISNCVLSYGREFILKMGSNQLKRGKNVADTSKYLASANLFPGTGTDYKKYYDEANPYFTKADGSNYSTTEAKDDYFIKNYVLTEVNLKDSVFVYAGLFSIGMESQFGGLALDGWDYNAQYRFGSDTNRGWGDVAGTSYPAKLNLEGDVRFYDWKEILSINSDTLFEADDLIKSKLDFNLDVSTLIESYRTRSGDTASVEKLMLKFGGDSYINAPIALYGGGKNYSIIDYSKVGSNFSSMFQLNIDVKYFVPDLNARFIYYSAGIEPFRFMVYEAYSTDENYLSYDRQERDLANQDAYNWLSRK